MSVTAETIQNHQVGARNKNLLREIILMVDRGSQRYARQIVNAITLDVARQIGLYYIGELNNLPNDWKAFADQLKQTTRAAAEKIQAESSQA